LTNLAGEWRGFSRKGKQGADCCENGRSSGLSRAVFWLSGQENRAALPHLKMHTPDLRAGVDAALPGIPHPSLWHFNCLVSLGRCWPGTLVVTNFLRFSAFRIINS
jgi:hypothetical protein